MTGSLPNNPKKPEVILDNLLRIVAATGTAALAALTAAMFLGLWIGPFLMPGEFITDTGPNIHSPYLWGPVGFVWVAALIVLLRFSKSRA